MKLLHPWPPIYSSAACTTLGDHPHSPTTYQKALLVPASAQGLRFSDICSADAGMPIWHVLQPLARWAECQPAYESIGVGVQLSFLGSVVRSDHNPRDENQVSPGFTASDDAAS